MNNYMNNYNIRNFSQDNFSNRIGNDYYERLIFPEEYPAIIKIHQEKPIQNVPLHYHPGIELIYSKNWELTIINNGDKHIIRQGEFELISPFALHAVSPSHLTSTANWMEVLSITFNADYLHKICPSMEHCIISNYAPNALDGNREQLKQLCESLCRDVDQPSDIFFIKINAILFQLLQSIFTDFIIDSKSPGCDSYNELNQLKIKSILEYVNLYYSSDLTTQMMAKQFGYTREHFCRLFKKYSGHTFKEYLTEIRLRFAIEEMQYSNTPCSQIAINNGFPDEKSFYSAFKKKFGMSPNRYRREHLK